MNTLPDFFLGDEQLFNRKKITYFSKIKTISMYFKFESGFTTTPELDYAEISDSFNYDLLVDIMTKEIILKEDLWKLILLFDNLIIVSNENDLVSSDVYRSLDFNELYFSVEY